MRTIDSSEARRERMSLVNMLPACARTLVAS